VVLEEDERLTDAFFSARKSTIFSRAEPSSSIFDVSPRGGRSPSASTLVREPPRRLAASTPRSPSESVSCGFFFAPMIPFSDG
jgi:hypothetical protein